MFSSRLRLNSVINPLMQMLETKKAAGEHMLDLTESNPTRASFDYDAPVILQALSKPESLIYEPHPAGLLSARRAIADYYRRIGYAVHPDSLILTASTSEAYSFLFKLLTNPGDDILIPKPGYPLFELLGSLDAVKLTHYPLTRSKTGWQIDIERLGYSISNNSRAIVVVNPNNPTGSFLKKQELFQLSELCREFNLALIIDEVFSDYGAFPDASRITSVVENDTCPTFVLNGFSKMLGLPQVKLAWIHSGGPEPLLSDARRRLEYIADSYLSVSTPVQQGAAELLSGRESIQRQIKERLRKNENFLADHFTPNASFRMMPREGGWYAVLEGRSHFHDDEFALQLLDRYNVLIHPGYFYDSPGSGFLVISLLTPPDILREGISKAAELING